MSTTVEDVDYLKKHGTKESYLFLVDSSKRDTVTWTNPAEYAIDFETPFRQVYGVDIIDATIPRTQYNIETFNNTFKYTLLGYDGTTNVSDSFTIEPADYEFNDFVTEFREKAGDAFLAEANLLQVSGTYKMDERTSTRSIKNKMTITCVHQFRVDSCSIAPVMGFFFDSSTQENAYVSTPTSDQTVLVESVKAVASATLSENVTSALKIRQPFVPNIASGIYKINLDCKASVDNLLCYAVIKDGDGTEYAYARLDENSLGFLVNTVATTSPRTQSFATLVFPWNIPFDLSRPSIEDRNTKTYYLEISVDGDFSGETLTIYGYNNVGVPYAQREDEPGGDFSDISGFHMNSEMLAYAHRVQAPYLYNFTGDTYLQIRCKEIEQHLFRTRAYEKYNAGLAKIPLGIFGFTNQDFDYTSFPPREFHPIGKLSTMTFRFERPDGTLYDFKGINHTFTVVIRYYSVKDATFNTKVLNPKYDPDILQYINNNNYASS